MEQELSFVLTTSNKQFAGLKNVFYFFSMIMHRYTGHTPLIKIKLNTTLLSKEYMKEYKLHSSFVDTFM